MVSKVCTMHYNVRRAALHQATHATPASHVSEVGGQADLAVARQLLHQRLGGVAVQARRI
jgi:hypothetical protein